MRGRNSLQETIRYKSRKKGAQSTMYQDAVAFPAINFEPVLDCRLSETPLLLQVLDETWRGAFVS